MSDSSPSAPKRFLVSWDQFHRDCKALAWRLIEKHEAWKGIIAVTRGGLIPAGIIARELEIKTVETLGISSYGGKGEQARGEINLLKGVDQKLVGDGDGWLVIDDLADSGSTAKAVRKLLPKAHLSTVYAKPAGEPIVDTYVTWVSQDTWIYFPWDIDVQPIDSIASTRKQS